MMESRIGPKMTYMFGHMSAVCLFLIPLVPQFRNAPLMLVVASLVGILNATSNICKRLKYVVINTSVPYALMAQAVSKEDVGMFIGFLSIMQVLGQMFANFIAGVKVGKQS